MIHCADEQTNISKQQVHHSGDSSISQANCDTSDERSAQYPAAAKSLIGRLTGSLQSDNCDFIF